MEYDELRIEQHKKGVALWIESQENYILEIQLRRRFALRDIEHFDKMIMHEKEVLKDYKEEVNKTL